MIKRLVKGLCHPAEALRHVITVSHLFNNMSDEHYLGMLWYLRFFKKLNLDNPSGYCEKLQWLKIHDHNPEYTKMVDKYLVKPYVASLIGEKYIIPTIGVWDKPDDVDFDSLPNQFVLKTNHAGGGSGVIICKDKSHFDKKRAIRGLIKSYRGDVYKEFREWPYKNVEKKVIAEKYLEDLSGGLIDYKVMCFNGTPRLIQVHIGRYSNVHTQDFYDTQWKKTNITQGVYGDMSDVVLEKPKCLKEMLDNSAILSKGIPHVRVDWYIVGEQLFFGELTFFDASGFDVFDSNNDEELLGSWIDIEPYK